MQNSSPSKRGPKSSRKPRFCGLDRCEAAHYAKGLCKKHYTQQLRHGRLTPERERGVLRVCKAPNCDSSDTIRFYCRKHARQIRVHGRLTPEREHCMTFSGCQIPGCDKPHRAKGLCATHYNQRRWQQIKRDRSATALQQQNTPHKQTQTHTGSAPRQVA